MEYSEKHIEKLDDMPSYDGTGRRRHHNRYRNEDLPYYRAKRWVRSQVGKSFKTAFAAWVKLEWVPVRLRTRNGIGLIIEFATLLDGVLHTKWVWRPLADMSYEIVYVCPMTDMIKLHRGKKRAIGWTEERKQRQSKWFRPVDDTHQLIKENGIWYLYDLKKLYHDFYGKQAKLDPNVPWVDIDHTRTIWNGSAGVYMSRLEWRERVVSKKQLSAKELKKYNVQND